MEFMLAEHYKDYNIIKHICADCVHTIYFDPLNYLVLNQYHGDGYSLLCKEFATSAINQGYQIVRNSFMLLVV